MSDLFNEAYIAQLRCVDREAITFFRTYFGVPVRAMLRCKVAGDRVEALTEEILDVALQCLAAWEEKEANRLPAYVCAKCRQVIHCKDRTRLPIWAGHARYSSCPDNAEFQIARRPLSSPIPPLTDPIGWESNMNKNKRLIDEYLHDLSGQSKRAEAVAKYVADKN